MKRILLVLLLLMCYQRPVRGQSLTLDQLILLRSKPVIDIDEYLVSRHWRFVSATEMNDSTQGSYWVFDDFHKKKIAELTYRVTNGIRPVVVYSTPNRVYFTNARAKIAAYLMEYQGQKNEKTVVWSSFRGATYDAILGVRSIVEQNYRTWYTVQVQRHGMVKLYYKDEKDGETKNFWFDEQEYDKLTTERMERERAKADSAITAH